LNRNLPSNYAKKELGTALLSILGVLKGRYTNLKGKIHKGIPLEEPPLSVESKLLSAFSTFASKVCMCFKDTFFTSFRQKAF
jgi:hypothetical protein